MAEDDPNKERVQCVVIKGILVYKGDRVEVWWKSKTDKEVQHDIGRVVEVSDIGPGIELQNLDGGRRVLLENVVTIVDLKKKK